MTTIRATAPITYQLSSLKAFGMEIKSLLNGTHYSEQEFESEKAAKDFLYQRAQVYADRTGGNLDRMEDEISKGYLTLDAVTGYIENE